MIKFEKTIIPHIKDLRKVKGINVSEFANLVGVSRQYVYNLEKGESIPTLTISFKISEVLGFPLEKIFVREPLVKHIIKNKTLHDIENLSKITGISEEKIIRLKNLKVGVLNKVFSKKELVSLSKALGKSFNELFIEG